jgi:hypothetical protein
LRIAAVKKRGRKELVDDKDGATSRDRRGRRGEGEPVGKSL